MYISRCAIQTPYKTVQRALLALTLLTLSLPTVLYAQDFNPFASDKRALQQSEAQPITFETIALSGAMTEVSVNLRPQGVVKIENLHLGDIYAISIETDTPGPLSLRLLQLDLDENNQVISQKTLTRADVDGGQATSLSLPNTLLPAGPIFIGIGARGEIKGTLRIAVDSHRHAKPFKVDDVLSVTDDRLFEKLNYNACFTLEKDSLGRDISIISTSLETFTLQAFVAGISPNTGQMIDTIGEKYEGKSPFNVQGLSSKNISKICLSGHPAPLSVRLKISSSKITEEPNAQLNFAALPTLKGGETLQFNTFASDTDTFRLEKAPAGKAHVILVNGVVGASVCFRESKTLSIFVRECFKGVRRVSSALGGDDYAIEISDIFPASEGYSVSSKLIDFDDSIDRFEPNLPTITSSATFPVQAPPTPSTASGRIRLKGSHISNSDVDTYHWADISQEQLWRIRAIGPGLTSGRISINGKSSVQLASLAGAKGRLIADDVFLPAGKAEVSLTGSMADYTVLFRPLGPPPVGFELEDGADGKGQRLFFGKKIVGQLRKTDVDHFRVSLTKPVAITLSLSPPLGARTEVYMPDVVYSFITPSDPPLKLTIPAGDHILKLTPDVASPMDYTLQVDRRNPFAIPSPLVTIKKAQEQEVRAWSDDLHSISFALELTNTSTQTVNANLVFETSTSHIITPSQTVTLAAGQTLTQTLDVRTLPDLPPDDYSIMVGLKTQTDETIGFTQMLLKASVSAVTSAGERLPALPPQIVGSIDMAHRFRGAKWVSIKAGKASFIRTLDYALDGLFITRENWQPTFRFERDKYDGIFDLKLGGSEPTPLVGVGFTLVGAWQTPLENIEIHTSVDGDTFTPWITGNNDFFGITQYMIGPVRLASYVRLILPSSSDAPTWTRATEFHVFAQPGKSGLPAQDLLRHGYSAKSHLNTLSAREQAIMKADRDRFLAAKKDGNGKNLIHQGNPISFRNTMQASIEAVEFQWVSGADARYLPPLAVKIMGATRLAGPWEEIGQTDISHQQTPALIRYDLPERTSVRFIRFDYDLGEEDYAFLPARTSVFEQAEAHGYISVLGEWDSNAKRIVSSAVVKDGGELVPDEPQVKGHVQFAVDQDTWTVTIPSGKNTLILDIEGDPGVSPALSLSQNGSVVDPLTVENLPVLQTLRYSFALKPEVQSTLVVNEDKRSTYILVKQSGAMDAFRSRILNGIVALSKDMVAGRDAIAISSMKPQAKPNWITDPKVVSRTLIDYFKVNSGGAADAIALTAAAKAISKRTGSKAILLIADGESGTGDPDLEIALQDSGARLFIAKPPGSVVDKTYSPANDVTTGWTQLAGGDVQYVTSLDGYEKLFSRVSAKLSGPKGYLISATAQTRILEPGYLNVLSAPVIANEERTQRTQLVLLDTSGSMLKRVGDTRRYLIARAALQDYVSAQEKAKTTERFDMIGLRTFGGPPDSCETEIVLAPALLDAEAFTIAVNSVTPRNNAKTPIAQALKSAADDISKIGQNVSLLLLTDGEETCGGDPLAAINALASAGIKTRLDVVSFALADEIDRKPFAAWAKAGGGQYVDAQTDTDLRSAIKNTRARRSFKVMSGDNLITRGQVGIRSEKLPPGAYDLVFNDAEQRHSILIKAGEITEFAADPPQDF